jgi:xylulokinase
MIANSLSFSIMLLFLGSAARDAAAGRFRLRTAWLAAALLGSHFFTSVIAALSALLLPFLLGERVPDLPEATGTLLGLRPGLLRPGHLYRAALEGTSLNLGAGLDRLRDLGLLVEEVRLTGGAAQNALWRQILADVFAVPVRVLLEAETAALGAGLQALWAVRRAAGEPELSMAAVAAPYVRLGETVRPQERLRPAHLALRHRFREQLARLHPGSC